MSKFRVQILVHVYVEADSPSRAEALALDNGKKLAQLSEAVVTAARHAERVDRA